MGATHLPATEFDGTDVEDRLEAEAEARLGDPAEPMVQLLGPDGTLGSDPVFSDYAERLDPEKLRGFYADMAKIRRFDVEATIVVTNASGGPIDRLELNTAAARLGAFRLGVVTVDGRSVTATVQDQTLVVPLGGVLPPATSAQIDLAFRSTAISVLHCSVRVINPASRRVIHKCGFQYAGQGMLNSIVAGKVPVERYRLDRKTWASLRSWGQC